MTCNGAGTSAPAGTCGQVNGGAPAPPGQCPVDLATAPCGNDGTCNAAGFCALAAPNVVCGGTPDCSDGAFNPGEVCDGEGDCIDGTYGPCPGGFACSFQTMSCLTACTSDGDCLDGNFCTKPGPTGTCSPSLGPGAACNGDANACQSNLCGPNATGGTHCCAGSCFGGGVCGASDCDATGACIYPSTMTPCSATECNGNLLTTYTSCDGGGSCAGEQSTSACPGNLNCLNGTTCLPKCAASTDCVAPATACLVATCTAGMCGTTNAPLGTTCTDNHGTTCDGEGKCVAGKYVFLTSSAIPANLGAALGNGARAYDTQCGTIATGRGFQGTWMAWISDSTTSPSVRFSQPLVNYLQLDGTVVAAGWAGLIASSGPSITVTELLASMSGSEVWTATDGTGAFTGASCSDWTTLVHSPSTTATVGVAGSGSTWTSDYAQYCDYGYQHLYCFQQ